MTVVLIPGANHERERASDCAVLAGGAMEHIGPIDTSNRFLKVYEAAAFCNMNRRTFSLWARKNRVPYIPLTTGRRHKLYDKKDVEKCMVSKKVVPGSARRVRQ